MTIFNLPFTKFQLCMNTLQTTEYAKGSHQHPCKEEMVSRSVQKFSQVPINPGEAFCESCCRLFSTLQLRKSLFQPKCMNTATKVTVNKHIFSDPCVWGIVTRTQSEKEHEEAPALGFLNPVADVGNTQKGTAMNVPLPIEEA